MSNKKNRATRKKAGANLKEERKPQGDKKPKVDPTRVRATLQHVNNALSFAMQNTQSLRDETASNIKQVWDNQSELKNGMAAAEYNLRAHQKALNAMAIELDHFAHVFNLLVDQLNDEVLKKEAAKCGIGGQLIMANVKLPPEKEGEEPKTVRRIDWPFYHKQVDKDLEILAKLEEKAERERKEHAQQLVKAIDNLREQMPQEALEKLAERIEAGEKILKDDAGKEFELDEAARTAVASRLRAGPIIKEKPPENEEPLPPELEKRIEEMTAAAVDAGNDPEVVQEEARRLLRQSRRVAQELGKMQRGEPYDEAVIAEAQQMIEEDQAKEDGDIPEGATVFGGG